MVIAETRFLLKIWPSLCENAKSMVRRPLWIFRHRCYLSNGKDDKDATGSGSNQNIDLWRVFIRQIAFLWKRSILYMCAPYGKALFDRGPQLNLLWCQIPCGVKHHLTLKRRHILGKTVLTMRMIYFLSEKSMVLLDCKIFSDCKWFWSIPLWFKSVLEEWNCFHIRPFIS